MKAGLRTAMSVAVMLGMAWGGTLGAAEGLQVGDKAPDFELKGTDGKTYRLSDFRGKEAVLIAWFPKAFTGGCTAENKSLQANSEGIKRYQVAYFTASCDDVEVNRKFAESLGLDYPILSDPGRQAARDYGLVKSFSTLPPRWTFYIGKDGTILHIDRSVRSAKHGEDVVAQLEALGIPKRK